MINISYNKIIVQIDSRVDKEINKLNESDQSKILEYLDLFKEYGFSLSQKYLKKVNKEIWELRPGKWRLFILHIKPNVVVVHIMYKKSQKMTIKTKKILEQRTKEYL